jgi:hypothetical protein
MKASQGGNAVKAAALRAGMAALVVAMLAGCASFRTQVDQEAQRAVGAEALATEYPICPPVQGSGTCTPTSVNYNNVTTDSVAQTWIGEAAADSVAKCTAFLARLSAGQAVTNSAFDITAIALSGAAAITVPIRSAQTLAALAGITTASKAAISSDVFEQNAAPAVAQKIIGTYMPEMRTFIGQTGAVTAKSFPGVYAQLLANHFDCSLTAALASLGSGNAGSATKVPLTNAMLLKNAVIVDLTAKQTYNVTTAYSSADGTVGVASYPIGTVPPTPLQGNKLQAASLLTTLNNDGAFLLTPGS